MPRLWLTQSADLTIRAEARRRRFVETGGPLFGYTDPMSKEAVVAIAFGPGPNARHRPRSFVPDRDATDAAIGEIHQRSSGALSYIGDWHTHPGGPARPSRRDVASLAAISSEPEVDLPGPVAIIVPTVVLRRRSRVREPAAFRWSPDALAVENLELTVIDDLGLPQDVPKPA